MLTGQDSPSPRLLPCGVLGRQASKGDVLVVALRPSATPRDGNAKDRLPVRGRVTDCDGAVERLLTGCSYGEANEATAVNSLCCVKEILLHLYAFLCPERQKAHMSQSAFRLGQT